MTCSHLRLTKIVLPMLRERQTFRCEDCKGKFEEIDGELVPLDLTVKVSYPEQ